MSASSSTPANAHRLYVGCALTVSQKHSLESMLQHHAQEMQGGGLCTSSSLWLADRDVTVYSPVGYIVDDVRDIDVLTVDDIGCATAQIPGSRTETLEIARRVRNPSHYLAAGRDDLLTDQSSGRIVVAKAVALNWKGGSERVKNAVLGLCQTLNELADQIRTPRPKDGHKHYSEVIARLAAPRHSVTEVVVEDGQNSFRDYTHAELLETGAAPPDRRQQKFLKLLQAAAIKTFWDEQQGTELPVTICTQKGGRKQLNTSGELLEKIRRISMKLGYCGRDNVAVPMMGLRLLKAKFKRNFRGVNFQNLLVERDYERALTRLERVNNRSVSQPGSSSGAGGSSSAAAGPAPVFRGGARRRRMIARLPAAPAGVGSSINPAATSVPPASAPVSSQPPILPVGGGGAPGPSGNGSGFSWKGVFRFIWGPISQAIALIRGCFQRLLRAIGL